MKNATVKNFVTEKNLKVKMPSSIEKSHLASRYLRKMVELKIEVLEKFRGRREFFFFCNETERVIYRLFQLKTPIKNESIYMKKLKMEEKEEMRKHSISKFNANVFPTAHFGRYYYLRCPISQLHAYWLNSHRKVLLIINYVPCVLFLLLFPSSICSCLVARLDHMTCLACFGGFKWKDIKFSLIQILLYCLQIKQVGFHSNVFSDTLGQCL